MRPRLPWLLPPLLALILLLATVPGTASGAENSNAAEPLPDEVQHITMNFKNVDLQVLIRFISELTGKNFLVDPRVKGQVTVIAPEKVTIDEAYQVFLSILETSGFTTVPIGKLTKIVPMVAARQKALETVHSRKEPEPDDRMITQLVPLKYADAAFMAGLLKPLVPQTGLLLAYPATNTLIVIDSQSNIGRLVRIIGDLDVPGEERIEVFPLENASAQELAAKLAALFQAAQAKGRPPTAAPKIIPDKRTNALVVRAVSADIEQIRELLATLDRERSRPRGNIHIYALQNAVAEDLAAVLMQIPGKTTGAEEKGQAPVLSRDIQITADKPTNSLVIIADPDEYQVLEGIIEQLDVPRTMVYVEALIMEVLLSKSFSLGVEWRIGEAYDGGFGEGSSGGVWLGGSRTDNEIDNIGNLAEGLLTQGLSAGIIGDAITIGDATFPSIGAFIRAAHSDSDFNIISTPQILTLDNEEAVIEVGANIPFLTQTDQAIEGDTRILQTFEYRDVGITLKVTPYINKSGLVRLKVEESVKSVISTTSEGLLAPTTTFRTAQTTILVADGQTAVIGGLMETRADKGTAGIPLLRDIPLLGWLFGAESKQDEKTNLMVFLTPHIIRTPEDAERMRQDKSEILDEEFDASLPLH